MLGTRIATVAVALPLFLLLIWAGGLPFVALAATLALVGFFEYAAMWAHRGVRVPFLPGAAACLLLVAAAAWGGPAGLRAALTAGILLYLVWMVLRFGADDPQGALVGLAGVVYVGWLMAHWVLVREGWQPAGAAGPAPLGRTLAPGLLLLLFVFVCTWAADTGGYFAGRAFGRRKLAPRLSPGKTWAGAVGGTILAAAAGWLAAPLLQPAQPPWVAGLLGAILAVAAVVGDLAESALKRHTGVKDSGRLLPGHGGVLDRFDSSLFTVPLAYHLMNLMAYGWQVWRN